MLDVNVLHSIIEVCFWELRLFLLQVHERPSSLPSSIPIMNRSDTIEKDEPGFLTNNTQDTVSEKG